MADVGKVVRITTDNKIEIIEIPWNFWGKSEAINADWLEVVKTGYMLNLFVSYSILFYCIVPYGY